VAAPDGAPLAAQLTPSSEDSTLVTETFDYSRITSVRITSVQAIALELLGIPKQNAAGIEATPRQLQARYPST
jgi:hypothetical protein